MSQNDLHPTALFGAITGGTIRNLSLTNVNIYNGLLDLTAGLIGIVSNSIVDNCSITGNIVSYTQYPACGLCCKINGSSTISRCSSSANIIGTIINGLADECLASTISDCYFDGGLVTWDQSYEVSGFIRSILSGSSITHCYNACSGIGVFGSPGAAITNLHGFSNEPNVGIVTSCYYDYEQMDVALVDDNDGIAAMSRTTLQMKTKATYVDWSFNISAENYGPSPWYMYNYEMVTPSLRPLQNIS